MRRDLSGGQPTGIQRQDDLVDLGESSLSFTDDDGFEGAFPVAGHLQRDLTTGVGQHRLGPRSVADVGRVPGTGCPVLFMPQVLSHLLVQRRLQHRLGELLEQPVRPGQGQPLLFAKRTSSRAAFSSADGSGFFFAVMAFSVVVITAPFPLTLVVAS